MDRGRANKAAWRRDEALRLAREGLSDPEIATELGVSRFAMFRWKEIPHWRDQLLAIREEIACRTDGYNGKFVSFRKHYLNTKTPSFQAIIARKIEEAEPGEVTMILMPPEHGKTTLLEDWCTYKLAKDPNFRITVASASTDHPKKVLARIRNRLEDDGPFPEMVKEFGPFAPDSLRTSQVWGQLQFNVLQRKSFDERDYSMRGIGIKGSVQGTRCDLLLVDDIQSLKDLDQTEKLFEILRQDFLSRPSVFGRTVIIGTRVGEFDVYRRLMDEDVVDHLITIPAYDIANSPSWPAPLVKPKKSDKATLPSVGVKFLWPQRYTPFQYATLRYRIGEVAWQRNYMQHPEAAATMTFDGETTTAMRDETRSIIANPRRLDNGDQVPVVVSCDPAVGGGNAVLSAAMRPNRMEILHVRLDYNLTKYSQIIDIIEEECHRYSTSTSYVDLLVIEDKAFQRGMLRDDRMIEVQNRFGLRIVPNTTGREKTDPSIGVPAMPLGMTRGEITIPWADPASQDNMHQLLDQLHIWRPNVDGVKLPQDLVMALWFAHRQWRGVRHTMVHKRPDTEQFRAKGSPIRKPRPRRRPTSRPYRRLGTRMP